MNEFVTHFFLQNCKKLHKEWITSLNQEDFKKLCEDSDIIYQLVDKYIQKFIIKNSVDISVLNIWNSYKNQNELQELFYENLDYLESMLDDSII